MALFRAICLLLCVHSESQTKSMIFSTYAGASLRMVGRLKSGGGGEGGG